MEDIRMCRDNLHTHQNVLQYLQKRRNAPVNVLVPDYYARFKCLMGACRHTCCAGWEIGVDEESAGRYLALPGPMGDRIRSHMAESEGQYTFRLTKDERCPFLRDDGLCDMIVHLGEESLCHICADHPRYRNHFSTFTEMGLGLCCEAAAHLILKNTLPVHFVALESSADLKPDEDEQALLDARKAWMDIACDQGLSIHEKLAELESDLYAPLPDVSALLPHLKELERLDDAWTDMLTLTEKDPRQDLPPSFDQMLSQLLQYLLMRHVPAALWDGDMEGKLAFCICLCRLLSRMGGAVLNKNGTFTADDFCDLCRMYSAEIEYSDENLDALYSLFM